MLLKEKKRFDYCAFGSPMPGRQFNSSSYRYGFNKMEKDDEVKGSNNSYTSMHRAYDPRLGKFLSVDPLTKEYPWNSTYAFAENDVIRCVDLDGGEKKVVVVVSNSIYFGSRHTKYTVIGSVTWDKVQPGKEFGPWGNGGHLVMIYSPNGKFLKSQYVPPSLVETEDDLGKRMSTPTHSGKGTGSPADGVPEVKKYNHDPYSGNVGPNWTSDGGKPVFDADESNGIFNPDVNPDPEKAPEGSWYRDYTYNGKVEVRAYGQGTDSSDMYKPDEYKKEHEYKKGSKEWNNRVKATDTLKKGELKVQ